MVVPPGGDKSYETRLGGSDAEVEFEASLTQPLSDTLRTGLGVIENLDTVNTLFRNTGRPELAMAERVEMAAAAHPHDWFLYTNFTPSFCFLTRQPAAGPSAPLTVPITAEELRGLRVGAFEYNKSGSHSRRPAFHRMHVLFPDFTDTLVLELSRRVRDFEEYAPELYVAYQFMSRLVDVNDRYVVRDGEVNTGYLCT